MKNGWTQKVKELDAEIAALTADLAY